MLQPSLQSEIKSKKYIFSDQIANNMSEDLKLHNDYEAT